LRILALGGEVMEQLSLLNSLETHNDLLKSYEKELTELEEKLKLKDLEKMIKVMEHKLEKARLKREEKKKSLRSCKIALDEYNYKIGEVEKNLYDGKTTDIKQLEYLSREQDRLKEMANNKETETLNLMNDIELIEKKISEIEESIRKYKDTLVKRKDKLKALEEKLKIKIDDEKKEISNIEGNISKDLLEKYYSIRKTKGSGISFAQNGVCNKCYMIIPKILLDRLNKGEIVFCEHCGRILCKSK